MPGNRHIVLRTQGPRWFASYSDHAEEEFEGDSLQAAINALTEAKGRRVLGQSAAEIDIAEVLARAEGIVQSENDA
jgi:hypothetical protein